MRQNEVIVIISENIFSHQLFKNVNREILTEIFAFSGCDKVKYKSGSCIFLSQKNENKMGIIEQGNAIVLSEDAERSVILRNLSAGDVFGVSTIFSAQENFVSNIVAKTPCTVVFLSAEAVKTLLEKDNDFMFNYIQFLSQRIRILNKRISCFTAGSSEKRLYFFLESIADENGIVELGIPMSTLCEMLDIGRASLYRAFEKLENQALIEKEGKKIKIISGQI